MHQRNRHIFFKFNNIGEVELALLRAYTLITSIFKNRTE